MLALLVGLIGFRIGETVMYPFIASLVLLIMTAYSKCDKFIYLYIYLLIYWKWIFIYD